jgi:serine/threonine protein kinase
MSSSPEQTAPNEARRTPEVPGFELLRPIGSGGFGEVWLARNRTTGQVRAVKLVPLRPAGTPGPAGRELMSLVRLEANVRNQHPHLLTIQHIGETADHLFYVMDAADDVSGAAASADAGYRPATLQSRLAAGPIPAEECLRYARQLLAGLARIHEAGMVHRDVKPANCLFVAEELQLADFGLVTQSGLEESRAGTLAYMPPDRQMDARADVFAAGLVLYEMITGLPVSAFPLLGVRAREIAANPILRGLNRVILQACAPEPRDRFSDAGKMLAALAAVESKPRLQRILRSAAAVGAMAIAVGIIALAVWSYWPRVPEWVEVNFITRPAEATIYLDGEVVLQPDGTPYTTPCTAFQVPARRHRVVFKREGADDLDVGEYDFAAIRQIRAWWPDAQSSTASASP